MMKRLLTTALAGLAGAALSVSTANAQLSGPQAQAGDLILGFYATAGTGAGTDLEVDLGSAATYEHDLLTEPGAIIPLNGSTALQAADIAATYGSSWYTNPNLFFGVISGNTATQVGNSTTDSMWASDPEMTPGTPSTPYTVGTRNTQASGSSSGLTVITGLSTVVTTPSTDSSESGTIPQSPASDLEYSYYGQDTVANGATFNFFNGPFVTDNSVTNRDSNGNVDSQIDEMIPGAGNVNAGNPATVFGTLELYTGPNTALDGTLVFDVAPEPSSIGLTGVGFLSLIGFVALRRRRSIIA